MYTNTLPSLMNHVNLVTSKMAENLKVKISPLLLLSLRLLLLLSFADVYPQILQIFQNSQFDLEKNRIIHILSARSRETSGKLTAARSMGSGTP